MDGDGLKLLRLQTRFLFKILDIINHNHLKRVQDLNAYMCIYVYIKCVYVCLSLFVELYDIKNKLRTKSPWPSGKGR